MSALPAARPRSRVLAFGALALGIAVFTSACAAGKHAQTAEETPAIDGVGASVGNLLIREAAVAEPPNAVSYAVGDAAELRFLVVNNGNSKDTLTSITSSAADSVSSYADAGSASGALSASATASIGASSSPVGTSPATTPTSASSSASASTSASGGAFAGIDVPPGGRVSFGINPTDPVLVLTGLKQVLYPATVIQVTFTFQNAGTVTVSVPVQITTTSISRSVIAPLPESPGVSQFAGN